MSYRNVSRMPSGLNTWLSHMSIWRDAQEVTETVRKQNQWKKVRLLGLDGACVLGWGGKQPVLVAVDIGSGKSVALGYVNEYDPHAVQRWLAGFVHRLGGV